MENVLLIIKRDVYEKGKQYSSGFIREAKKPITFLKLKRNKRE